MYTLGARVELIYPSEGSTATVTILDPTGVEIVEQTVNTAGGEASFGYTPFTAGRFRYHWRDNAGGAKSGVFNVRSENIELMSLADMKEALNIEFGLTARQEQELVGFMNAATSAIEMHRSEVVAVREFRCKIKPGGLLPRRPVVRAVSVVVPDGWPAVDVGSWLPDERTGALTVPGQGTHALTVTYVAGYPVVPDRFIEAAKIIVRHLWETQGANRQVSEEGLVTIAGIGYAVPNRAIELIGGRMPVIA